MGHVRSKTRSLGQILEKPCESSGDHIFNPIIMKLRQNICLDVISSMLESEQKIRLPGQTLQKPCVRSRGPAQVAQW